MRRIFVIQFESASHKGQFEVLLELYIDPRTPKRTPEHSYPEKFQADLVTKKKFALKLISFGKCCGASNMFACFFDQSECSTVKTSSFFNKRVIKHTIFLQFSLNDCIFNIPISETTICHSLTENVRLIAQIHLWSGWKEIVTILYRFYYVVQLQIGSHVLWGDKPAMFSSSSTTRLVTHHQNVKLYF